jgi:hypothetical protein
MEFSLVLYTVDFLRWEIEQPVAEPLITHATTQTDKLHTDIHALSWILIKTPAFKQAMTAHLL